MKILFIISETKQMGVSIMISYLKQNGHEADLIVDPWLMDNEFISIKKLNKIFSRQKWAKYLEKIEKLKPSLIGFSVNTANYQWALEKARFIKDHLAIPIIFGGPHPTILPEETIINDCVDMVAIGEAEESLLEYANNPGKTDIKGIWFKFNGQIIKNSLHPLEKNLDKYPFPDDDLFYQQLPPAYRFYPDVLSGRGCPYDCTYCNNATRKEIYQQDPSLGPWLRQLSIDRLIKELIWRKEKHYSKIFDFKNEVFSLNDSWLREFVREYKKYVNLPFYCYFSLNLAADEERIVLLKEAGCQAIHFGLQSGCQKVRKQILNRHERDEEIFKGAENCHKYKMSFSIHCLLDLPFETEEQIKETIISYNKLRPSDVSCYSLLYFPKAKIIEQGMAAGYLKAEDIEKINKGLFNMIPRPLKEVKGTTSYRKYALLLTSVPLLSKIFGEKIIIHPLIISFFKFLPINFFLPLVKFITMKRGGWGHLMPSIIYNELFNLKQHLFKKI